MGHGEVCPEGQVEDMRRLAGARKRGVSDPKRSRVPEGEGDNDESGSWALR